MDSMIQYLESENAIIENYEKLIDFHIQIRTTK